MATKVPLVLGTYRVPILVKSAVKEEKESELNMVCVGTVAADHDPEKVDESADDAAPTGHDPVRINQVIKCPKCERTGSQNDFPRGKDNGDGTFTVLTAEQVAEAKGVAHDITHSISLTCYPTEQVTSQTVSAGKFYWLAPDKFDKEYALFVWLVEAHPELAFCTVWAYRTLPAMYRVVAKDNALGLQQLAWPEETEAAPTVRGEIDERFKPIAEQLVEILTDEFDANTFRNSRRVKMLETLATVQAVHAGEVPVIAAGATDQGDVAGLLAALHAAAAAKGITIGSDEPKKKAAPKKRAAKKVDPAASPPLQALPAELPDNVIVVTTAASTPKKRRTA